MKALVRLCRSLSEPSWSHMRQVPRYHAYLSKALLILSLFNLSADLHVQCVAWMANATFVLHGSSTNICEFLTFQVSLHLH